MPRCPMDSLCVAGGFPGTSSRQLVVFDMDRTHVAGPVHRDGGLRHRAARHRVAADLAVPGPADEDGAFRPHAVAPAAVKGPAANEGLADHVAGDPDAVGIADEDRVDVRIVDPVALDRDVSILETV